MAISPATHLSPEARAAVEPIWKGAVYPQELVEPYLQNSRTVGFPMTRTWTLRAGALAATLSFTRVDGFASTYAYVMRDAVGAVVESGTVELNPLTKPHSQLDFIPSGGGPRRRGLYSIHEGAMQLDYSAIAGARPTSLEGAALYETK